MKTMHRKLNVFWEADVEFAVPARPAGASVARAAAGGADSAERAGGPPRRGLEIRAVLRSGLAAIKQLVCQPSRRLIA